MRLSSTDDVTLELHDLGGEGPPLLIAHATGFCGGAYRPMAAYLVDRFHIWALDFRGHGDSTMAGDGGMSWQGTGEDVLAAVDAIDAGPVFGFGHSMGGASLMVAELMRPGTVRRAFLYEPIIFPKEWGDGGITNNPLAASARRRRPTFASRQEALARYASRPPLGTFRADVLSAYVEHGFADAPDGTVTLKCSPEHEAATYEAPDKPAVAEMAAIDSAVVVASGARDPGPGPAHFAPLVAEALPHGELRVYAHLGHFGPLQDPATLADDAAAFFLP